MNFEWLKIRKKPIMKFEKISVSEATEAFRQCDYVGYGEEKIQRVLDSVRLPERSTANSAGYDFFLPDFLQGTTVALNEHHMKFPLLVKCVNMPSDCVLLVFNRSSLALKNGFGLDNGVGVIDADYNKCIYFQATCRNGETPLLIKPGMKICQGIFMKFCVLPNDSATGQRNGGIGSTGK